MGATGFLTGRDGVLLLSVATATATGPVTTGLADAVAVLAGFVAIGAPAGFGTSAFATGAGFTTVTGCFGTAFVAGAAAGRAGAVAGVLLFTGAATGAERAAGFATGAGLPFATGFTTGFATFAGAFVLLAAFETGFDLTAPFTGADFAGFALTAAFGAGFPAPFGAGFALRGAGFTAFDLAAEGDFFGIARFAMKTSSCTEPELPARLARASFAWHARLEAERPRVIA